MFFIVVFCLLFSHGAYSATLFNETTVAFFNTTATSFEVTTPAFVTTFNTTAEVFVETTTFFANTFNTTAASIVTTTSAFQDIFNTTAAFNIFNSTGATFATTSPAFEGIFNSTAATFATTTPAFEGIFNSTVATFATTTPAFEGIFNSTAATFATTTSAFEFNTTAAGFMQTTPTFAPTTELFNTTRFTLTEATTAYSPLVEFFTKVVRNEIIGARHCEHSVECGVGLTCNLFWNICTLQNTPVFTAIEKSNCTLDADCMDQYFCINGACRFCGPTPCHSSGDCCMGMINTNVTFDCIDIEKLEKHHIAKQLLSFGKGHRDDEEEMESEEMIEFGATAWGDHLFHHKRCWARCFADEDCNYGGWPAALKGHFGCCNGFCTRKESCVSLPANFVPTFSTAAPTSKPAFMKANKKAKSEKKHHF